MNILLTLRSITLSSIMVVSAMTIAQQPLAQTTTPPPAEAKAPEMEEKKEVPLAISGQVDAYFRSSSAKAAGLTSYAPAINSFGLGMVNLAVAKDLGKVSFVGDVMFGPRAEATNYLYAGNSLAFLKQLYVSYKPTDKLKFTLGNFMTFVGYELVEASNNLNYSMSYNYTNGPFFHTGAKIDYALTDKFSAMVGVFDQTDTKGLTGNKQIGGQLAYVNGGFKAYLNLLSGKGEDTFSTRATVLDLTTSYQVTPKFGLGLNITNKGTKATEKLPNAEQTSWLATAIYLNYAVSDKFILAARGEQFNDKDNVTGLYDGAKITAFTLSGVIKIDALSIIPEIRIDSANKELTALNGKKSDTQFILAAVYKF
jgi:Putative beta-barrel porin-2, OmpL-like. bbp2